MRSHILRGGLGLLFAVGVSVGMAQRADAGDPLTVVQHNVFGQHIGAIRYASEPGHQRPLAITAQEVCAFEFLDASDHLRANGYNTAGYFAIRASTGNGVCPTGVAMLNLVGSQGAFEANYSATYDDQALADYQGLSFDQRDRRGYICMKASFYLRVWIACSTHFAGSGVPRSDGRIFAELQAGQLRAELVFWFQDMVKIIGVDFNRRPCQGSGTRGPADFYADFHEADQEDAGPADACGDNRPTHGTKKIDYIWVSKDDAALPAPISAQRVCGPPGTGSDHCFYFGDDFEWK